MSVLGGSDIHLLNMGHILHQIQAMMEQVAPDAFFLKLRMYHVPGYASGDAIRPKVDPASCDQFPFPFYHKICFRFLSQVVFIVQHLLLCKIRGDHQPHQIQQGLQVRGLKGTDLHDVSI